MKRCAHVVVVLEDVSVAVDKTEEAKLLCLGLFDAFFSRDCGRKGMLRGGGSGGGFW